MAVIIRSDATMTSPENALGKLHGYDGPSDFRALLDFSNEKYTLDGAEQALSSLMGYQRAGAATYVDRLGRQKSVASHVPRIHSVVELAARGLLLERDLTNYLASDDDGAAFTCPSGNDLVLSWRGTGTVTLNATGATLVKTVTEAGRMCQFFSRSGAITGTISVSGTVADVMITNSIYSPSFIAHGQTKAADTLQFAAPLLSLIAGGDGSILTRFVLLSDSGLLARNCDIITLYNSASPHGLVSARINYQGNGGQKTGELVVAPDGAGVNGNEQLARNLGNVPPVSIDGVFFGGYGATGGLICYGDVSTGVASEEGATPPTAFDQVHIGRVPNDARSGSNQVGLVLTHLVVYDRQVTADEARVMSRFGA